jgi:TRAF3-interacting protein 1
VEEQAPPLVPIITESARDDDEDFVVRAVDEEPVPKPTPTLEAGGQHGGLVQKILQTKRQLEQPEESRPSTTKGPVSAREIQVLRDSIQSLC